MARPPLIIPNQWGNFEDEETHIVFFRIPLKFADGPRSRMVAVGIQNHNASLDHKGAGILSIKPLDATSQKTCKDNGWFLLANAMMEIIKRHEPSVYSCLLEYGLYPLPC